MMFAHSLIGQPLAEWETLPAHLSAVATRAAGFAAAFGCAGLARAAGQLHDIGKASVAFQTYIAAPQDAAGGRKGPDHSTAGARQAMAAFPGSLGRMLAAIIAGHHAGLGDGDELDRRLDPANHQIAPFAGWQAAAGPLPATRELSPTRQMVPNQHAGFAQAFLMRMLFSCLVDADFLETEAFYAKATDAPVARGGHASLETLRDRLCTHLHALRPATPDAVNTLRARVLDDAMAKAALPPGLFTLTVPTGGGKTLTSLAFALEHALHHGLRRVVYVIPFTAIIEQTADVFRKALGTDHEVLEHHASFDWEKQTQEDDEGPDGVKKLQRAAENWDVPVVVTTTVQFFESLFANRTSRCRKLHNLAGAVIVLDEAQTLPLHVLRPCMAALDELARNYGASVVLCTATQPALRTQQGFKHGLDIPDDRELAPDPRTLYTALKRVRVDVLPGKVPDAIITARFNEAERMLCIVNTRAHARALYESIRDLPGALHLTTLMCPKHRRAVLTTVREKLVAGAPARLVATSLIEAGVDVDFPEVWRAAAGLDSIAQAAGRCNRNGHLPEGRVVVFEPAEITPPREIEAFFQATRPILRGHDDLLGLDAIEAYFSELYWQKGEAQLDATEVDGLRGVLPALRARATDLRFPFRGIGQAFRLIDDTMDPVIVPWDADAHDLLRAIAAAARPPGTLLRRLQQYVVSIPRRERDAWLRLGALRPAHPALGEAMLAFADDAHYRQDTGLDLRDTGRREATSNVM
jgi:CRISPR-associated endonuclease/helicase Cas3